MTQRALSYVAIVLVAIATAYGVTRYVSSTLSGHQHALCVHQNSNTREANSHTILALRKIRTILAHFTQDASVARYAAYKATHQLPDLTAAQQYAEQHNDLLGIKVPYYPTINCQHNA